METVANPFAAPETQELQQGSLYDALGLAEVPFRISGDSLLCGSDVSLPPVCVITGQTTNLTFQSREIVIPPPEWKVVEWVVIATGVCLLAGFLLIPGLVVLFLGAFYRSTRDLSMTVPKFVLGWVPASAVVVVGVVCLLCWLQFVFRRESKRIHIRYYVDLPSRNRSIAVNMTTILFGYMLFCLSTGLVLEGNVGIAGCLSVLLVVTACGWLFRKRLRACAGLYWRGWSAVEIGPGYYRLKGPKASFFRAVLADKSDFEPRNAALTTANGER
ncbi:MAG: hypothetical protein KDA91_06085 [Planctomycetaceae bacterium]|nr:hypothetical protein [Planctomycetaceae bacterium]